VHLIPIFDTSAIIDLSRRDSADPVRKRLSLLIPKRGCPLSYVTVLELFYGLSLSGQDQLDDSLKAVSLASRLSRRKVLLSPIPFLKRELFGIRDSGAEQSSANLTRWLGIAIRPTFKGQVVSGRIEGMSLENIKSLFAWIDMGHSSSLETYLTRLHPTWRSERQASGSSLPEAQREEFKRALPVDKWKSDLPACFIEAAKLERTQSSIDALRQGCDAYFTYSVNLMRASIISNYRFEDNPNDFHDGMQLLYLSRPVYCLVTEDKRSIGRAEKSSQSSRILIIDQFVSVCESEIAK
jgi:hypothetical protein